MHVSKNAIQLVKQKIRDFGNITRRPGTGRPKTTTVDDDLALVNVIRLNQFQSAIRTRQQSNFPASLKTGRRRIRQTELKNRCAANKIFLSEENKRQRLMFAEEYVHQNNLWEQVVFSDEKTFQVCWNTI
jgi:hypothetical protein